MIQLGFFSAILAELSLEEVLGFASGVEGVGVVELAAWPRQRAERRYSGVTHVEVEKAAEARRVIEGSGVGCSALGYYPNVLSADGGEAGLAREHLVKVIRAAAEMGVGRVNTFAGRDPKKSVEENWPVFLEVWKPIVKVAEKEGVRIGIENCPMWFTGDEWPGGKNLATTPAIWRRMFAELESPNLGLNYDPSHLVWQGMDYLKPLRGFADKLFHVHAKDVRVDREMLDEVGPMASPLAYHKPKLPGLGEIEWGRFFSVLGDVGYAGAVCVEVEDRVYEGSLEGRKAAVRQSVRYLRNFV